jgi:hypothetical protein
MSIGRQVGAFLLVGLGVGLGFAAIDAVFGPRKVVVKDVYNNQPPPQHSLTPQHQLPLPHAQPRPSPPFSSSRPSSVSPSSSSPSASDCNEAVNALADCESRNGFGSPTCRSVGGFCAFPHSCPPSSSPPPSLRFTSLSRPLSPQFFLTAVVLSCVVVQVLSPASGRLSTSAGSVHQRRPDKKSTVRGRGPRADGASLTGSQPRVQWSQRMTTFFERWVLYTAEE